MVAVLLAVWPAAAQDPQAGAAAQSGLRAVVLDPAQSHVDLASAVTVLAAGDGLRLDDATALVPDAEEVAFARSWRVLTLVNREAADQTRILSLDRTALWGSGIAPVRSGFVRLGNWRTVPDGAPPPERVRESTRMRPGEAR